MATPKLVGISGSLRRTSHNTMLLAEAARLFGDAEYHQLDIDFPLYNGDVEDATGIPAVVKAAERKLAQADAVLISTTEYNSGPSGVLKNALDWSSRVEGNPWNDKPVVVMSAAAGRAGGERAQVVLRGFLTAFRPRLLTGPQIHVAACHEEFDENERLKGEIYVRELGQLMDLLRKDIAR